jgi:GNAT superfamily N-acetyltransferase
MMANMIQEQPIQLQHIKDDMTFYSQLFDAYAGGMRRGISGVHEAEGRIVGVILAGETATKDNSYNRIGDVCIVWGAWVEPEYRAKGIAQQLTKEGVVWARRLGFTHIETAVLVGNEKGEAFALSVGAKPYSVRYLLDLDPEGW